MKINESLNIPHAARSVHNRGNQPHSSISSRFFSNAKKPAPINRAQLPVKKKDVEMR